MAASITDLLDRVTDSTTGRPVISALAAPGKAIGAASVNITDNTNWTTTTAIHFSIYETVTVAGISVKNPTTQTDWKGVLSGTTISNLTITGGTDREYTAGAIIELTPTARYAKDLYDLIIAFANQDGSLKSAAVQAALNLGSGSLNGWLALGYAPNSVTCNPNKSYDLVFTGVDLTSTITPGMRLKTIRTATAPTGSIILNGTSQYANKTSPAGMTFTDDFTVSAWIKLSSYGANSEIVSRYNGTSGWVFRLSSTGQPQMIGFNAGAGNNRYVLSYQSVPLNRWVHVSASLDMSGFTTATCKIMIDGVDVQTSLVSNGTNPTSLIQAGNLEVGSSNGGTTLFPGKIAQVAIYSANVSTVTQANIRATMSQTLTGSETSLVSAYKLDQASGLNDLSANANNLTAQGAPSYSTTDTPFTQDVTGTSVTAGTTNYAIVEKVSFSTNTTVTVQVPEGCTLPTTGGITSVTYSANKIPYGFPGKRQKWRLIVQSRGDRTGVSIPAINTWTLTGLGITLPVGAWVYGLERMTVNFNSSVSGVRSGFTALKNTSTWQGVDEGIMQRQWESGSGGSTDAVLSNTYSGYLELAAATTYNLYVGIDSASGTEVFAWYGSQSAGMIYADNAYL